MKKIKTSVCKITLILFVLIFPASQYLNAQQSIRNNAVSEELFDEGWFFFKGGALSAETFSFDDSGWRRIDLPHDWSIEDLPGTNSPFNPDASGQVGSGFTTGGTGWYRKHFFVPVELKNQEIKILFEGIYMNSDVWLNGVHLGNHPYGYTSFWLDLTKNIRFGEENILSVQVKNEGANSRWYSGSGIYRHVWLKISGNVHFDDWGCSVTTPEITSDFAKLTINNRLISRLPEDSKILIKTFIVANTSTIYESEIEEIIQSGKRTNIAKELNISNPILWSTESPFLYKLISEIWHNNQLVDRIESTFGIRKISFDNKNGFQLNGKTLELKGGCVHHDNGPLGSRAYDRAEERRVELLKASGFNAIRCAHNPPSPAFLNACDRLGMLVIDEAFDMWINANNPYDYHLYFNNWWQKDIQSMVNRDINHPSIILWSIGNEIKGMDSPEIVSIANDLATFVRKLDNTRPVTAAVNDLNEKKDAYFAALDVCGYNYGRKVYETDHIRHPERIMYCSESYPLEAFEYWTQAKNLSWVIGDFVWTAFDHLGEASIGWRGYLQEKNFYPWNIAYCGDMDICGWKRPQSFYRDVLWNTSPTVSVFIKPPQPSFPLNPNREDWSIWHWEDVRDSWTWPGNENNIMEVEVYSSGEVVELFLNNKSLGKKESGPESGFITHWKIPYSPGELKAVTHLKKGKTCESILRTAGPPVSIKMTADRTGITANGQDLCYITVELTDKNGNRNPISEELVNFELSGPGKIVAVANGNPMSIESFQQNKRLAWRGRCMVIVKSEKQEGEIRLKASVSGLPFSEIIINSDADH